MISVFTKIIDLIFLNTRYYIPILLFMLAVMGTYKCYKVYKLPKYILYSMICICVDVFVTYVLYNVIKSRIILFVMAIILVGIILYAIWHYISISHTLRRVINFSDEERFDANFVEAWNLTYDLKTSVMTKKQLDKYNRYRIFLRAKLGCFHANEQELKIYENGDRCQKAFYHFIRFIQYLAMGEVQKAYDNIKEAEALSKWSVVEEYLKNASALYHENGLLIDEIMTKLALVDEASDVINCDEHLQFTRKDEMFRTLDEVEAMLPKLEQHPVINEIALRISFYSVALNDYLRCKNYYELYRKSSDQVSIDHYAPWVHKYHMDVIFCVRILYIVDSINKIIDHIDDFDLSPLAREWFAGFGKIGGDVIHLVIGLLIGFDNAVSLKECLLLDEANRIVDNYEWMNFPEFGLEIDVQNTDVIFFHPGQHPLENEKIKKCIFETVIELDKFSVEQQSALQEVCKIITENMVSESPTIDELKAVFNSVMLPKTII